MTASSWPQVRLKDLGTWCGGGTPSKSNRAFWTDGTVPWLSPKDMGPEVLVGTQDHITQDAIENSSVKRVPGGSVALVVRSGILERTLPVALVPFDATLNQDMKAVVPRPDIDARWIAWGLRASEQELLLTCRKAGTTVASMEMPRLYEHTIPVPPLDTQRRIVDILEDHISRLDAGGSGIALCVARLASLKERALSAGLLGETEPGPREPSDLTDCGTDDGQLPNLPIGWTWRRLGDIATVVGGVTKDSKRQSDPAFVEVPYLRVANVQRGWLDLGKVTTIRVPANKAKALRLLPGDVLMNEGGDRDKLARGWVWEGQVEDCIHQNHVFRARVVDGAIDPKLLSWAGNTLGGRWAERNGKQSVNLASISLTKIRQMPVPVPQKSVQSELVKQLEDRLEACDRLTTSLQEALTRSATLRRSLLATAFSGLLKGRSTDMELVEEMANV